MSQKFWKDQEVRYQPSGRHYFVVAYSDGWYWVREDKPSRYAMAGMILPELDLEAVPQVFEFGKVYRRDPAEAAGARYIYRVIAKLKGAHDVEYAVLQRLKDLPATMAPFPFVVLEEDRHQYREVD